MEWSNHLKADTYLILRSQVLLRELVEVHVERSVDVASVEVGSWEIEEVAVGSGLLTLRGSLDMTRIGCARRNCLLRMRWHLESRVMTRDRGVGVVKALLRHRDVLRELSKHCKRWKVELEGYTVIPAGTGD